MVNTRRVVWHAPYIFSVLDRPYLIIDMPDFVRVNSTTCGVTCAQPLLEEVGAAICSVFCTCGMPAYLHASHHDVLEMSRSEANSEWPLTLECTGPWKVITAVLSAAPCGHSRENTTVKIVWVPYFSRIVSI